MNDREAVAAIAAGDPAGIAAAYDRYAAALYGYCLWLLRDPADAAEALRDAFVTAAAAIEDLPAADKLRPWLYAVAGRECRRRLRAPPTADSAQADPAGQATDASNASGQADMRTLVRSILAELKPRERVAVELVLRHKLYDDDLAIALGVPLGKAQAREARARDQLEKSLGALLITRTGREACPELDALLAGWDGQLTERTRDLVSRHTGTCTTCASRKFGAMRPAAVSGLQPPAELPPELREQILTTCASTTADPVAHPRQAVRHTESARSAKFWPSIRRLRWRDAAGNPGPAAAMAVAVCAMAVCVAGIAVVVFAGLHSSRTVKARPSIGPSSSQAAAVATTTAPMAAPASASARPSRGVSSSPGARAAPLRAAGVPGGTYLAIAFA
jgi:RNA polymerase sigma factor (sigma-70 family)